MGTPCELGRVRTFLKKAEDRFSYEMAESMLESESFRLRNVEETTVGNEQGGPTYKVMRNFTKTDFQFDFGGMELVAPNGQDSGCLTEDCSPCNIPSTKVGGSGWQTMAWAYFREKLRSERHCLEDFRDIPDATSYLRGMIDQLPEIANDRLDMFFRGLEYFYSTKHIVANKIKEIKEPYTTTKDVEDTVSLLDINGDVVVPSMLTPRIVARIYSRLRDLYGRKEALGTTEGRPIYGMQSSEEILDYYHIDNPEVFEEVKYSDTLNPVIAKFGLSQILGKKIIYINDENAYRANIDAQGQLKHVKPYVNTTIDGVAGAGYETIRTQDWRQADLEYVTFVGKEPFAVGYQDAFMPIAGDDMQEIGKRFDWRMFNDKTCEDEDANWFHYYATARFYVRPKFRRNLIGFYFPVNPERLDARFFGNGACPIDIEECNCLPTTCNNCVEIVGCCDSHESQKLLVTFDQDVLEALGIAAGDPAFIRTRSGDVLSVIVEAQSAKDNDTFVIDFTPAGLTEEPCCADGEMLELFTDDACSDTLACSSGVYDACPSAADFSTYTLFLERPVKCIAAGDALIIKLSDGTTVEATATGTYDAIARKLEVTPATVLTPDQLCQKYITGVCCVPTVENECPECEADESDRACEDIIDSDCDGTPDVDDADPADPNVQ